MIGGVVGQLTLLLAAGLGLLIWTAYGVFSTQQTELQTIAARALEFDLEMRQYGPEADEAREILRTDLVWAHEQFWGDDTSRAAAYDASFKAMASMSTFLDTSLPKTPGADAFAVCRAPQLRFHRREPAAHVVAGRDPGLLAADLCRDAWSCLMFGSMGLLSRPNPTTAAMLVLGAASVALAIFLILEFNKPYTSSIRVSPVALEQAIVQLDQPSAANPSAAQ